MPSQKNVVQDLRKQLIDSNKLAAEHAAMNAQMLEVMQQMKERIAVLEENKGGAAVVKEKAAEELDNSVEDGTEVLEKSVKETEVLEEFVEKEVEDMPGEKDEVVEDMQKDEVEEAQQKDEVEEDIPAEKDEVVEDMLVEKAEVVEEKGKAVKPLKYPFDWNPEGLGPRGKLSGATRLKYKFTKYYPRGASLKKWIEFTKDQKKKKD